MSLGRPLAGPPLPRLFLITDPEAPLGLVGSVGAALAGIGADRRVGVILRAKAWSGRALVDAARDLATLCASHGAVLLVNGRADVAAAVGAAGVQLPEGGLAPAEARVLLGPAAIVGRSCHDREGLLAAAASGADFATSSPVHAVPGKNPALGIEGFAEQSRGVPLPVIALGGVRVEDVPLLLGAGAYGVAVIRAVLAATEPATELRRFLSVLPASEVG